MRYLKVGFSIIFLLVMFGLSSEAKKRVDFRFNIKEDVGIEIYNKRGSIDVKFWNKDYLSVKATMVSWSWNGEKELESVEIKIDDQYSDNIMEIKSHYLNEHSKVEIYYDISIPQSNHLILVENITGDITIEGGGRGGLTIENSNGKVEVREMTADLVIRNSNGEIEVDSCRGTFDLRTTNAQVKLLDSVGDSYIKNSNARVRVLNVAGKITIDSKGGTVKVVDVRGAIDIKSTFGRVDVVDSIGDVMARLEFGKIKMQNLDGFIDVETGSGDIEILQTKGIIKAVTGNGDIEAELYNVLPDGVRFETDNGDIKLYLHYNLSADIKIYNPRGRIKVYDLELELEERGKKRVIEGTMGDGGPELYIESQSGDIKLYEL